MTVTAVADGVVLTESAPLATLSTGSDAGSGSDDPTHPSFAQDIYPRLQRASAGGLGCADCHTNGGAAAILPYDGEPGAVLAAMLAVGSGSGSGSADAGVGSDGVLVIDLVNPARSLLLVKPLYEVPPIPQDHPNATFLDTNDPNYQLFLLWITQGAKP